MFLSFVMKTLKLVLQIFNISFFVGITWIIYCQLNNDPIPLLPGQYDNGEFEDANVNSITFIDAYDHGSITGPLTVLLQLVYFAFTTLSTVGFGDFNPKSDVERLFCCAILVFGVAIFSYIMGNFIEILINFQEFDAEIEDGENLSRFFGLLKSFNGDRPIKYELMVKI